MVMESKWRDDTMSELSEFKKMLFSLSDRELMTLFEFGCMRYSSFHKKTGELNGKWFDKDLCGLPKDGIEHLKELEKQVDDPMTAHHVDRKLLRYLRTLKKMKLDVPAFFRNKVDPKMLFRRLKSFCEENDIPEEIIQCVVPALVSYVETGYMRPVIFVGEKGCGKTTAVRMLVEEALRIPTEIIKVPQTDGGHGMTGDCGSYQSADAGCIAKARFKHNSLIVALLFDEIDKVAHEHNRSNVDDELLSITDSSNSDIYDNYLECSLVELQHCPMFFTANDIKKVNPILVDRCTVIQFPNANAARIKSIARKYVEKELKSNLYHSVVFNYEDMNKTIDNLVNHDVTSLRKHQQLIESVLREALNQVLIQETDTPIQVTDAMFSKAEREIIGTEGRKIGFGI